MAYPLKSRLDKCDLIKLQSFCKVKDTVNRTQWQPTDWEKGFSNPISDRGLISNTPRRSRRQEIIKLRAQINQGQTKRTIERINRTKSWFLEKINKLDKPIVRLTRGPWECVQINKIRNEKGDITTESEEIKKKHQILQQKPVFNKTWKSGGNGQFPRQIQGTKVKSGIDKPFI